MNERNLEEFVKKVESIPYHKFIKLKITSWDKGQAVVEVKVTENILNPFRVVHGGIFYTICDVAAYIASNTLISDVYLPVTSDINVSVLSPVNEGVLRVYANVIKAGKRLHFIESKVFDQDEKLVAVSRITKSLIENR